MNTEPAVATAEKPRKYFTIDELAEELGVAPRTLQHWRQVGRGPGFVRYSERGPVRYPVDEVRKYQETAGRIRHMSAEK